MTQTKKVILIGSALLLVSGVFFLFSQDAKKKRYNRTVVPPEYALRLIKRK